MDFQPPLRKLFDQRPAKGFFTQANPVISHGRDRAESLFNHFLASDKGSDDRPKLSNGKERDL